MKKLFIYSLLLIFSLGYAQKMAYVDTKYILKQMPQYQQSEQRLNNEIKRWQEEILNQQSQLEKLRIAYENEKVLLTEDQQKTRLSVIDSTEKYLNEFIEKKFGTNGESTGLRHNLVKPLQDQIWNAIDAVAAKDKYNIIFDKSSDLIMVFTDSRFDITDKVLKQLGAGGGTEKGSSRSERSERAPANDSRSSGSTPKRTKASGSEDEAESNKSNTKPKSGYGSKYVPKKKQKKEEVNKDPEEVIETPSSKEEIKESEIPETSDSKVSESQPVQKTTNTRPKSGYGSKYVPKKQRKNVDAKEESTNNK